MKLQRKWARATSVFLVAAVILVLAAEMVSELVLPEIVRSEEAMWYRQILTGLMFGSIASVVGALVVMRKHLCCPRCKALSVNPWQKRGTIHYCSKCCTALAFDDGEI